MSLPNWGSWARGLLVSLSLLSAPGCANYCYGDDCGCEGERECIVDCPGGGCDIACSHTSETCGAICGNDCRFECSDTNHCSTLAGDGARLTPHHLKSSATECGADCDFEAENISEVEVTVGRDSTVYCHQVHRCDVTCEGPCELKCENVDVCELDCKDGTSEKGNGSNRSCQ